MGIFIGKSIGGKIGLGTLWGSGIFIAASNANPLGVVFSAAVAATNFSEAAVEIYHHFTAASRVSADAAKPVLPEAASERISAFEQREKQARQLTAGGHVPSRNELDAFFNDGLQSWTAPTPRR